MKRKKSSTNVAMSLSKEEENFTRFAHLLIGICPTTVRVCFDGYFSPPNLSTDLLARKTDLEKLKKSRIVNSSQWKLLFPSTGAADSKTFDITLMICLIRNLKTIQTPLNGFDSLPPPTETIPAADLARIKYYRNYLAHLDKAQIDDALFNSAWAEIANPVGRLGGNVQKVNDLRTKILDRSNHSIMTEVKNAMNEIGDLKHALKDSTEEMMAFKMKEIHEQHTRAENRAYKILKERNVLILAGRAGSGKTTLAFHLMKRIKESIDNEDTNFNYIELKNTTDLKTVLDNVTENNTFVLFIDDPFGKSNTNKSWFDEWGKYFEDLHVKQQISCNIIDEISWTDPVIGFPQSCHLFFSNPNIFKTGVTFFKKAREGLKEEISLLYSRSEYDKKVLAVLVFMLLEGGEIDLDKWSCETPIHQQVCDRLGIKIHSRDLKNILIKEKNYFMVKDTNYQKYNFTHETILESILMVFAEEKEDQIILLKFAADHVVKEFLRSSEYKRRPMEVCVVIHEDLNKQLLDTLLQSYQERIYPSSFPGISPSEIKVIKHATFQDKAMEVMLWELIDKRNIINSQKRFIELFECVVLSGHEEFLDSFWRKYCFSDFKYQLSKELFGSVLQKMFRSGDNSSVLQKLLDLDKSLLNLSIYDSESIGYPKEMRLTPLILYALDCTHCYKCVKVLLDRPVDLTVRDCDGDNALHLSVKHTWTDVIQEIIRRKPELLNQINNQGQTPFLKAACYGKLSNVYLLIDNTNNLLLHDSMGNTILHRIADVHSMGNTILHRIADVHTVNTSKFKSKQFESYDLESTYEDHAIEKFDELSSVISRLVEKEPALLNSQNKIGITPLVQSILHGQLSTVQTMLELKPDLAVINYCGNTALHYATERINHQGLIRNIVNKNTALLNSQNFNDETPLVIAIKNKRLSTVKTLLGFESDLTVKGSRGNTALHVAIETFGNSSSLIKELVDKKFALLNLQNDNGETPIIMAIKSITLMEKRNENPSSIQTLFDLKPDLTTRDNLGNTVLHYAVQSFDDASFLIKELIDKEPLLMNIPNMNGQIPLLLAIENENLSSTCIKSLLELVPDLHVIDNHGNTTLHCAARRSDDASSLIRLLVTKEPSLLNSQNRMGETPLFIAIQSKNVCIIQTLLVELKCDFMISDYNGNGVLHRCVQSNMIETAKHILAKNKDILNLSNSKLRTPLMDAFLADCVEMITVLLAFDPDISIKDCNGNNILHAINDHTAMMIDELVNRRKDLIYEKNNESRTPIEQAVISSNVKVVNCLLNIDASMIFIDRSKGHTLLHLAAEFSNIEVCETLLGCDINLKSLKSDYYNMMTPLHVAAERQKREVFLYLLSKCEDIEYTDIDDNTVLHYCMGNILTNAKQPLFDSYKWWSFISFEILDKNWSLLNFKNKNGDTPLLFALSKSISSSDGLTEDCHSFNWMELSYFFSSLSNCRVNLEHKTKNGENMLHLLAINSRVYTNEILCNAIQKFAQSNFKLFLEVNSAGLTPIMVAASTKNYKMFQMFLQINLFTRGKDIKTLPLYCYSFPNKEFQIMIKEDRSLLFLLVAEVFRLYRRLTTVDSQIED